jgi:hypothetical protein
MGNALAVAVTCGHTSCGCDVLLTVAVGGRSNEAGRNVIEKKTVEDSVDDRGCCTREQASPVSEGLEIYTSRFTCARRKTMSTTADAALESRLHPSVRVSRFTQV